MRNMDNNEWNASLSGDYLWSNVNFGEAVTEVMTPLTWSVIQFTLDDWIFLPGYSTVGNIGGYPYLNISIFASLYKALGRSQQDLLNSLEGTLYMRLPEEMRIPLIPRSLKMVFSGLLNLARVSRAQRHGIKRLPNYLADNPTWFKNLRARIPAAG
jgi:hypothetical protein